MSKEEGLTVREQVASEDCRFMSGHVFLCSASINSLIMSVLDSSEVRSRLQIIWRLSESLEVNFPKHNKTRNVSKIAVWH